MIAHIEGILESKIPTQVVIDVSGVGYMLNISLNTYDELPSKGKLRLFSHLIVREDAHILYGFSQEEERTMFRELINVSGVGASTALMVCGILAGVLLSSQMANIHVMNRVVAKNWSQNKENVSMPDADVTFRGNVPNMLELSIENHPGSYLLNSFK